MTDFTKFEFGASFEVLWLKSPTSPSPKTLRASLKKNCSMVKQLKTNKK
jgi:hypothetical protein